MRKSRDERDAELLEEIKGLRRAVAELKGERDAIREEVSLADRIRELKLQISDLEIGRAKITEDHEREKREVTHMVGLERKRVDFEIEQATKTTALTVREENLAADRKRFDEQMEFNTKRFEEQVTYLQGLMKAVLERLPTVTVEKSIDLSVGNGHKEPANADG